MQNATELSKVQESSMSGPGKFRMCIGKRLIHKEYLESAV